MYMLLGHLVVGRVASLVEIDVGDARDLRRRYYEARARYRPLEVMFLWTNGVVDVSEDEKNTCNYRPRFGKMAKRGVDFRYSTRIASRIRHKKGSVLFGEECLNTRFPQPTQPCAAYSLKLQKTKQYVGGLSLLIQVNIGNICV